MLLTLHSECYSFDCIHGDMVCAQRLNAFFLNLQFDDLKCNQTQCFQDSSPVTLITTQSWLSILIPSGQQSLTDVRFGIGNAKDMMSLMLLQSFIRRGLGNVDK